MDFVIPVLLFAKSFYTGISFWRYGTSISTDVRATIFNPWSSLTVASSVYLVALFLTPSSFDAPFLVNSAEFLMYFALIISAYLGDQNFKMLKEWDSHFIRSLGDYFIPEHPKSSSIAEGPAHLRYQPSGEFSTQMPVQATEAAPADRKTRAYTPFSTPRRPTMFEHPTSMPLAPGRSSSLATNPNAEQQVSPNRYSHVRERLQEQQSSGQRPHHGPKRTRPAVPRRPRVPPRSRNRPPQEEQHEEEDEEVTSAAIPSTATMYESDS